MPTAAAEAQITKWDEQPYHEADGEPKMARTSVGESLTGDLEGELSVEYVMVYRPDGSADFTGLERFVGVLAGKRGSFVLVTDGTYVPGVAKGDFRISEGSGTGDLAGITGKGSFHAEHGGASRVTLEYELG